MNAEALHREKLKSIGYKDAAIEEFVSTYRSNNMYEFAEEFYKGQKEIDKEAYRSTTSIKFTHPRDWNLLQWAYAIILYQSIIVFIIAYIMRNF